MQTKKYLLQKRSRFFQIDFCSQNCPHRSQCVFLSSHLMSSTYTGKNSCDFQWKVRHSHVGSSLIVFETYISELCFPQQSCQWMTRMSFAHNRRHCRVRLYRSSTGDCLIHTSGNNPLTDALLSKLILHRWPLQPCQGAWQLYPEISLLPRAKLILLAPCILFCLWLWFLLPLSTDRFTSF